MEIIILNKLLYVCKLITLRIKLPQMGQLRTICSTKLNTAIFRKYYRKFVHVTYDIEDIAKCALTFINISIIIVTYKRNLAILARITWLLVTRVFVINLITQNMVNEQKTRGWDFFAIC